MASRSVPAPAHLRLARSIPASSAAERARGTRGSVLLLLVPTTLLVAVGLVMVLSSSSVAAYAQYGSSFLFFQRQGAYAIVGIAGMLVAARMPVAAWRRLAVPLLAATVVLLLLVLLPGAGTTAGGSARWLRVGPATIQPSELAKLALVVFGALILAKKERRLDDLAHLALPLLPAVGIVCLLVMLQPDLGTTLVLSGTVFLMLFTAGVRLRVLALGALLGSVAGYGLIMSEGYRRARFLSFLRPWADPLNAGWQLKQSLIALGSGGWLGVGVGASRQKWLYVPNAHTDFIFAILGEELGLIAAIVVLVLFGVLLYAGVRVAARAPDPFSRFLSCGIVAWLGLQAVVNLGAVTGLLPITGVPLPLLSYGGSSLVVTLTAIGVLAGVARANADRNARPRSAATGGSSRGEGARA